MNEQRERENYLSMNPAYHEIARRKAWIYHRAALAANVPQYSDLDGLAHELWGGCPATTRARHHGWGGAN